MDAQVTVVAADIRHPVAFGYKIAAGQKPVRDG
jgi:hypothetical protein